MKYTGTVLVGWCAGLLDVSPFALLSGNLTINSRYLQRVNFLLPPVRDGLSCKRRCYERSGYAFGPYAMAEKQPTGRRLQKETTS